MFRFTPSLLLALSLCLPTAINAQEREGQFFYVNTDGCGKECEIDGRSVSGFTIPTPDPNATPTTSCPSGQDLFKFVLSTDTTPSELKFDFTNECPDSTQSVTVDMSTYTSSQVPASTLLDMSFCVPNFIMMLVDLKVLVTDSASNGIASPGYIEIGPPSKIVTWDSTSFTGATISDRFGDAKCDPNSLLPIPEFLDYLVCFSADTTVHTKHNGPIFISELQVGDKVLTGSGQYETVYTIDHQSNTKTAQFIQIYTDDNNDADNSPVLEVTSRHMVYVHDNDVNPIPASELKVGIHQLQTMNGPSHVITKMNTIIRNDGVYNPITTDIDATIVVNDNGIIASSYSAQLPINIVNYKTQHTFFHMIMKPLKFVCTNISQDWCNTNKATDDNNDKIGYSKMGANLYYYWSNMSNTTMKGIVLYITVLLVTSIDKIIVALAVLTVGRYYCLNHKNKSKKSLS